MTTIEKNRTITLDKGSIDAKDLSMPALMQELNQQKQPNFLLRKLMNILENKRMKKKLGWSRAWNKYGVNNFRTHKLFPNEDWEYLNMIKDNLKETIETFPAYYQNFVQDLFADKSLMVFTFYHNSEDIDAQYEGLTLSFGRKYTLDKTKRDRLDIVFEDRRHDGSIDGKLDRIKIYVNPYEKFKENELHTHEITRFTDKYNKFQAMYDLSIHKYNEWKSESDRSWLHWSINYIDYFGSRQFIPKNSSFL